MRDFHIFFVASWSRTLYIGMTNDLQRRISQHRTKAMEGFSKRYSCTRLVYYEVLPDSVTAIGREKELKGWLRIKKIALIESMNLDWNDLWTDIRP